MTTYETVIGLEVHVELATKTKIFCSCSTEFGAEPNTQCCPVCTAMPGVLPVLNKAVLEYAIKAGVATNCDITRKSKFDRKNYFYPDLPKAFQTSQLYMPICKNGHLEIKADDGGTKNVYIHQIHMEEDAGKLLHSQYGNGTLIDYNRCGVPLVEIVSEPNMRSAAEAINYVETLRNILLYIEASDCKLQEGSMRVDINLSLRPVGQEEFGTRTEMKNLNSFRAMTRAIEGEIKRQTRILEKGERVIQETRRWDDEKGESYSMRSKEDAHDYRYFPEPDLMPLHISEEMIEELTAQIPELPKDKLPRYLADYKLSDYDAELIIRSKKLADIFEIAVAECNNPKEVANFLNGECVRLLNANNADFDSLIFEPTNLGKLINHITAGKINKTTAKAVFEKMYYENIDPIAYIAAEGLEMVNDDSELEGLIAEVIAANPKVVEDYKGGKQAALGFFVGQIMKATKGRADAASVNKLLKEMLSK